MNVLCLLGIHDYKIIKAYNFIASHENLKWDAHAIQKMCRRCKKIVEEKNWFDGGKLSQEAINELLKTDN